ncbi:MAG: Ldh family oxidoreductase [Rhodospirillaceae bacterium]|nr:Ldh family oxidoreductase [Rhodospirillaceae bacterium]
MSDVRLTLAEGHALAMRGLTQSGVSPENALPIANVMMSAERDACQSHGLFRMPGFCTGVLSGRIDGKARPSVEDAAPGVVRVDAHRGYAAPAIELGMPVLIEKARTQGVASMAISRSHHFSTLWCDVEHLAEHGLVGFAFVNSQSFVAHPGGVRRAYGTNPMAFGWPRPDGPPLAFDQASSVAARGEMQIHLRDGKPIPEGWGIGPDGAPTTDPAVALEGAQLPFGDYKGAALAMMIELLAVGLTGGKFGIESSRDGVSDGGPAEGGQFFIAIDPATFAPGGDVAATLGPAESLFDYILEEDGTRLPGDRRHAARERTPTEGFTIPASLHETIMGLCGE